MWFEDFIALLVHTDIAAHVVSPSQDVASNSFQVLHEGANPMDVLSTNLSRPLHPEISKIVAEAVAAKKHS